MRQISLILVIFGYLASAKDVTVGNANYHFDDPRFTKTFEKTLIFGHSISSELFTYWMPWSYGEGPGTVLSRDYANKPPLRNIAEGFAINHIADMETGLEKMHRWVKGIDYVSEDEIYSRRENRSIKNMNKWFDESTAIVGVDALYFLDRYNFCSKGWPIKEILDAFIEKTYRANKTLILGSVPKEDPTKLTWLARQSWIIPPQNEHCRQFVNTALRDTCTADRNCFIVDLEFIVHTLNTEGSWTLKDGTVLHTKKHRHLHEFNEIRPDGVNLSPRGTQIIVEDILRQLKERASVNESVLENKTAN